MSDLCTYQLSFRSPLHIGERGVGLEETRTYISADTLFGAICIAWRELYGVEDLHRDVLDWYCESEPGMEPFFLTSAFPCAADVRFLPKPLRLNANFIIGEQNVKEFKRIRFVSEKIFNPLVSGRELEFHPEECVNQGTIWATKEEIDSLNSFTDDQTGKITLWKSSVVPHVTLDTITNASEIWNFGELHYTQESGLWFAVKYNPEHGDFLRKRFESCLLLLGDMGLGGKRSSGHGLFDMKTYAEPPFLYVKNPDLYVTLSPICPKNVEEVAELTDGKVSYELMPIRGWVTSLNANNLRRKMVWMFAEGSVLNGIPNKYAGRLVDVTPDDIEKYIRNPHKVWRYGYAFPVGVKLHD